MSVHVFPILNPPPPSPLSSNFQAHRKGEELYEHYYAHHVDSMIINILLYLFYISIYIHIGIYFLLKVIYRHYDSLPLNISLCIP